jgi:hypothetical protein
MQQEILEPLSLMTQSSLSSFAELFSYILSKRISGNLMPFSRSRGELMSHLEP